MNPAKYAPKDAKLIRDNPGLSPQELLEIGLSGKAYERMIEQNETDTAVLIPVSVTNTPVLPKTNMPVSALSKGIRVKNMRTQNIVTVTESVANMLLNVYPKEYQRL